MISAHKFFSVVRGRQMNTRQPSCCLTLLPWPRYLGCECRLEIAELIDILLGKKTCLNI